MKYTLSTSDWYITCLSSKCGLPFSIEDCMKKKSTTKAITCPYCEYKSCLECYRPWDTHDGVNCDEAKKSEDAKSEATLKKMGAKPCPNCGINIQKDGGCDHIKCKFFVSYHLEPYVRKMLYANIIFQVSTAVTTSAGPVSSDTRPTWNISVTALSGYALLPTILVTGFLITSTTIKSSRS